MVVAAWVSNTASKSWSGSWHVECGVVDCPMLEGVLHFSASSDRIPSTCWKKNTIGRAVVEQNYRQCFCEKIIT